MRVRVRAWSFGPRKHAYIIHMHNLQITSRDSTLFVSRAHVTRTECVFACVYIEIYMKYVNTFASILGISLVLFNFNYTVHTLNARDNWHTHTHTHAHLVHQSPNTVTWLTFRFHYFARRARTHARLYVYEYVNISTLCREPVIASFCIKSTLFPILNKYYIHSVVWACVCFWFVVAGFLAFRV